MSVVSLDERVYEELQVLEAIFTPDLMINHENGIPKSIEINVVPSTGDKSDEQYVRLTLAIILTPDYPERSPQVYMKNPRGLDDQIIDRINQDIREKLSENIGHLIVYEVVEMVRECLTQSNLPQGQCVICLHCFLDGDIFVKTPCFHYFHNYCLGKHLIAGKKYYDEELAKLPAFQRAEADPYQQICPVCRNLLQFKVDELKTAPPPLESLDAQPFHLTDEVREMQERMAELMAHQISRGGVIGVGDLEPPPLIITDPADVEEPKAGAAQNEANAEPSGSGEAAAAGANAASPTKQPYQGPFRGFNRRNKPGRRGRGAPR